MLNLFGWVIGMPQVVELFSVPFVFISIVCFMLGVHNFISRFIAPLQTVSIPAKVTVFVLGSVFLMHLLDLLGLPGVLVFGVLFFGLQIIGIHYFIRCRRSILDSFLKIPLRNQILVMGSLGLLGTMIWMYVLSDVAGLTSAHDGMAHTNFFMRLLESNYSLLIKSHLPLAEDFGHQSIAYYPSGCHAVIAALHGWIVKSGILSGAEILKAWLVVFSVLPAIFAMYVARQLFTNIHWPLLGGIGLIALSWGGFPGTLVDSGGFSRLITFVIVMPGVFYALQFSQNRWYRHALSLVAIGGGFAMHPGPAGLLAFSLPFAALFQQKSDLRILDRIKDVLLVALFMIIGSGVVLYIVFSSGSDESIDQIKLTGTWWSRVEWRWRNYYRGILGEDPATSFLGFNARILASYFGLMAALGYVRKWKIPLPVQLFPFMTVIAALFYLGAGVSEYRFLRLLGTFYYANSYRFREASYLGQAILWCFGTMTVASIITTLIAKLSGSRFIRQLTVVLLVTIGLIYVIDTAQRSIVFTKEYIWSQNIRYETPRYSLTEDMAKLIRRQTESNAVIVTPGLMFDGIEARTGRYSLMVFLQCYLIENAPACLGRQEIIEKSEKELALLKEKGQAMVKSPCFGHLGKFSRPVYMLSRQIVRVDPGQVCKNSELIGIRNDMALYRYLK